MSRSLRRLMKEASELSSSPSPHFHAAPVSDENLYDWHFTLAGPPPPSAYASGIYHGRIVLPPTYPLRPPSFRFLTPSGRFEVNREICLSISGHHEETWQPAWGIRTALLAIRSFMEGDARGQVGGLEGVSDEIRRQWAGMSRGWRCEVCAGGKSNEEVLKEWRGFCVERGVDVEKEEEVEGVPAELRLGAGKEEGDGSTNSASMAQDVAEKSEPDSISGVKSMVNNGGESMSSSALRPPGSTSVPLSTSTSTPTSTPAPASPSRSVPQTPMQQQQRPTPTRTTAQAAPVASQDTPWLDRAIFGVLIALILMIMRRVVDLE
ncbi:ubiquitin-conjugating enzyme/RWD-like protein [Aspergillus aurantiobrunneus]